ncbi:MAG: hypothetical protein AMS24_02785 [Chlamydiae bacterium SM23_39]|nr:MAG: hypothetical protein AMS24_02785 [Chlamydiae bacterium SM23_39]
MGIDKSSNIKVEKFQLDRDVKNLIKSNDLYDLDIKMTKGDLGEQPVECTSETCNCKTKACRTYSACATCSCRCPSRFCSSRHRC